MQITIDNLDGNGALDYSAAMYGSKPLEIVRQLNKPTVCSLALNCGGTMPASPKRGGRISVIAQNGAVLFTGYLATEPVLKYAGAGLQGGESTVMVEAISDDYVLNRQNVPQLAGSSGQSLAQMMSILTARVDATRIDTTQAAGTAQIGSYEAEPGKSWSENAGALASMARSSYRIVNGRLTLAPIGSTTHSLSDAGGTLNVSQLKAAQSRMLANDVTVCGLEEPTTYVTELFQGDGTTVLFDLYRPPMSVTARRGSLVAELFDQPGINRQMWQVSDSGSRFSLTASGLSFNGGSGVDGATTLLSLNSYEVAGALILEAGGVQIQPGSEGYLCALYSGTVQFANCLVGFHVKQTSSGMVVVAVVQGAEMGAFCPVLSGHSYTLRARLYCKELQRVHESFWSADDNGTRVFGGDMVASGAQVVVEVQDVSSSIPAAPVVLYDGYIANTPAVCVVAAVNSTSLVGSMASIRLTQTGTTWVRSQLTNGNALTRRLGTAVEGADAKLERTGKLRFYPASVPALGELVQVSYRLAGRAVARLCSAESMAAEGSSGLPGSSRWIGSVKSPAVRSSVDCENAAAALLDMATSRSAAWVGKYKGVNLQLSTGDVWPGDVLNLLFSGTSANVVVRMVQVEASASSPETLTYSIDFANDWADDLAIKRSDAVPVDVWLPQQPVEAPQTLACLDQLAVTLANATELTIAAGATAPANGGFEVRRRDWSFGNGDASDLVLRSPVSNFSIPREQPVEQFFIRMYDGSTPPNYSRFSSAVIVNVPM